MKNNHRTKKEKVKKRGECVQAIRKKKTRAKYRKIGNHSLQTNMKVKESDLASIEKEPS